MQFTNSIFKNLTVIETANVLAGPSVGMFFAELGATVIKVENINTGGDITRSWKLPSETTDSDISAYFSSVNWGKKSIGIDYSISEGYSVLIDLLRNADIFLQSFKLGDAKKFNLDYPTLQKVNDRLIYASITAFGEKDDRLGYDAILQAETGFMGMNGTGFSGPVKMPVALIDVLLAHQLKEALLIALIERLQSGHGSYNTVSLFDSGIASLVNQGANSLVGKSTPTLLGSDHPNIAPYGTTYKNYNNDLIVLAVGTNGQFESLCEILGIPNLSSDPRFETNQQRVTNRNILNKFLVTQICKWEREALLEKLRHQKVPAGAVKNLDEILENDSTKQMRLDGTQSNGSTITGLRSIAFENNTVQKVKNLKPPPNFNIDSYFLLTEMLNYSDQKIEKLKENRAIV